jgi:hypothetical protein
MEGKFEKLDKVKRALFGIIREEEALKSKANDPQKLRLMRWRAFKWGGYGLSAVWTD